VTTTTEHQELFERAERLLPKYGGLTSGALNQATLLDLEGPGFSRELLVEFEAWLEQRG
jgi:hypothetical protein